MRFSFGHQINDARQHGFRRQFSDFDFDGVFGVDGAGKHLVADRFGNGDGFACDRRLIERRLATQNCAVQRNSVAGANDDDIPAFDLFDWNFFQLASGFDARGFRSQFAKSIKGAPCSFHGAVFQCVSQAEQKQQKRAFEPGTQKRRADSGQHHQRFDIYDSLTQRQQRATNREKASGNQGQNE